MTDGADRTSLVGSPSMASHGIQTILEESQSDAILFYDACESAETAVTTASNDPQGVTELISACGFQTTAPGPSSDSFAFTLTAELRHVASISRAVPLSEVYSRILAGLRNAPNRGEKTTPVHTSLTWSQDGRSIMLEPLKNSLMDEALEIPLGAPTYALYLQMKDGVTNVDAWRELVLKAPPQVAQVYFEHPNVHHEIDDFKSSEADTHSSEDYMEITIGTEEVQERAETPYSSLSDLS